MTLSQFYDNFRVSYYSSWIIDKLIQVSIPATRWQVNVRNLKYPLNLKFKTLWPKKITEI